MKGPFGAFETGFFRLLPFFLARRLGFPLLRLSGLGFFRFGLARLFGFDGELGRSEARDRNPVGRTRNIVHAQAGAELDALGLAAVLAANADFELLTRGTAQFDAHLHQLTHAGLVQTLEGVVLENGLAALLVAADVIREEAPSIVAAQA